MKTTLLLFAALGVTALAQDDDVIPKPVDRARYKDMLEKSPFALATPPEPEKQKEAKFTDNMYVKGLGKDYVIAQRLGDDHTMRFWGNSEVEGIIVKEVKWSEKPGETSVILKKGGEEGEITFNQNDLHAATPPPNPGGARPPGSPGGPGGPPVPGGFRPQSAGGGTMPAGTPRPPVPQPTVTVPRPTATAIQAPPAAPQGGYTRTQGQGGPGGRSYGPGGTGRQQQPQGGGSDATGGRSRIRVIRQ
jgi:hypothetical protein